MKPGFEEPLFVMPHFAQADCIPVLHSTCFVCVDESINISQDDSDTMLPTRLLSGVYHSMLVYSISGCPPPPLTTGCTKAQLERGSEYSPFDNEVKDRVNARATDWGVRE